MGVTVASMKTKLFTALVIVLFAALAIWSFTSQSNKIKLQEVELRSRETKLKINELKAKQLNTELDKLRKEKSVDSEKIKQLEERQRSLESENAQLQARKEEKSRLAKASSTVINTVTNTRTASAATITGDKYTWLAQSGIPQSEWQYVDHIVSKESGWRPCAYYPSQNNCGASPTTACGLAQSLPCGKQSVYGHWTDPVANLKWMNDYVKKYGGWAGAYAFWTANSWY